MNKEEIIKYVDDSIKETIKDFRLKADFFFTEDDIVCYLYHILFSKLNNYTFLDNESKEHCLIHKEYPTPFKCDMKNSNFFVKNYDEKFRRGHYDLVVLNPLFIENFNYNIIKAQNLRLFRENVISKINYPVILYGIEFMFNRDIIKKSKGIDEELSIKKYWKSIIQDTKKLKESYDRGFIKRYKTLVFIKTSDLNLDIRYILKDLIQNENNIEIIFDK